MKLVEYEAKELLRNCDIPTPASIVGAGSMVPDVALPVVIKSQVPVGGRGKAGGVKIANTPSEVSQLAHAIAQLPIKGFTPTHLLYEELLPVARELYLSLVIDRASGTVQLMAHSQGGVEIEQLPAHEFLTRPLTSNTDFDSIGDMVAEAYGLPEKAFVLGELLKNLYACFTKSDATLLEINPLVVTADGKLIAGDCKMTLDDAAAFRHPEWQFEDKPPNANFVVLNPEGTVATIANGAGLAMATVDAVTAHGLVPANFLDIGGSATTAHVVESFKQIMSFPSVTAIVINIFGGIVRCDIVAQAITEATDQLPDLPALYIRLSGNNSDKAAQVLSEHGLTLYDTLDACLQEIHP